MPTAIREQIVARLLTILDTLIPDATPEERDRPFQFLPDSAGIKRKLVLTDATDAEDYSQAPHQIFHTMTLTVAGFVQATTPAEIRSVRNVLKLDLDRALATAEAERLNGLIQDMAREDYTEDKWAAAQRPGGTFRQALRLRYWTDYADPASVPATPPPLPDGEPIILHDVGAASAGPVFVLAGALPPGATLQVFLGGLLLREAATPGANEYAWNGTDTVTLWRAVGVDEYLVAYVN